VLWFLAAHEWRLLRASAVARLVLGIFSVALLIASGIGATRAERERATIAIEPDRHAWIQVVSGAMVMNGASLSAGDGASVSDELVLEFSSTSVSQTLVFDLA